MVDTGVGRSGDERFAAGAAAHIDASGLDLRAVREAAPDGLIAGPALAATLADIDPAAVTDYEVLEALAGFEVLAAWVASRQAELLAEFVRRPEQVASDPVVARVERVPAGQCAREFAADEVAARLRTSVPAASRRIGLATALDGPLRRTAGLLGSGRIDVARAHAIADGCAGLADEHVREVETRVIDRAPTLPPARLREAVRRAVLVADPDGARDRCRRARTERRVVLTPVADGMAELWALLPAADAVRVKCVLSAVARAGAGDGRTADQRMADALVAPFAEALVDGELRSDLVDAGPRLRLARHRGEPVRLQVTVPASTLLGISREPGELAGYGPITAEAARELAADATWRRIVTDPVTGEVLDVGTTSYRPPASLRRHVEQRDRLCRHPSCGWPAQATDLDHTVPYPDGPTARENLGALCRRHHRFKHAGGAGRLRQSRPGVFVWTLPTGHRYTVHPPPAAPAVRDERRSPADDEGPADLT